MALFHYLWSRTAASNSSADSNVNWAEGQAPSSVNDSARAMMASLAGYRDDISGTIVTGGTSTAYTVTSFQEFDTLAHMSGRIIAFTPHATNGQTVTLNVDGLGAKPLRSAPSVELPAGTLIQGTPYTALYNNSDAAWYLHGFYGNAYNIPLAGGIDYWGTTAPNSSFVFPIGQAISRTTYSALFALMGTTHGVGDGSTTFNLPDKRGRVSAAADGGAGRLTDLVAGFDSLGEAGGSQTHTLTTAELAAHGHTINDPQHFHVTGPSGVFGGTSSGDHVGGSVGSPNGAVPLSNYNTNASSTGITINNSGSGAAHNNVQPTIVCNYILRII
jgi:microcystin-dependent protein